MNRILCLATLIVMVIAGTALASVHPGADVLGLSTSADADGEFLIVDPEVGSFDLYLLAYGYEHPQGIAGWECALEMTAGLELVSVTLEGKADPVTLDPADLSLRVFPLQPLMPSGGIVHLATLHLNLVSFEGREEIYLRPHSAPQTSGTMSFALESSASLDQAFAWPGDCAGCAAFQLLSAAQPVVSASWDRVKSLYR